MQAKEQITVEIRIRNGRSFRCTLLVPYWWEEQDCRRRSVVRDEQKNAPFLDRAVFDRLMIDLMLERIETETATHERQPDKRWSDRLKPFLVRPINDAYDRICGEEMLNFKEEVEQYFTPELRPEGGVYVAPPEVLEYVLLRKVGGMTRQDVREMSYVELHKFHIVSNIASGGSHPHLGSVSSPINNPTSGLVPLSLMSNPDLSAEQVRVMAELAQQSS